MPLFQTSVLNKYLAEQDKQLLEQQYVLYKIYFLNNTIQKNIIASKEEEFQEGFLRELFVKILGYTINPEPDFNLKTELKNIKDSKKADGAIVDGEKVLAIIELKGTDTINLNQIEIQAFGYKNNQDNCKYVITSNFQKLRFYIDNAIEFLEWDLFKLDFENFKLLFLCLGKDNIFKNLAASIKIESVTVEENVTKRLYKEYSGFRKALFNNIADLNPHTDKLLLFKKTQKLLDRFLFLFFAEDRMLVPPNSVRKILEQWNSLKDMDAYQPLYARFKLYFGYLNTGHKGKQHDIFAYNGGLFAPDEVLDNVLIDDGILYEATLSLSNYDYNSEIDVNILGHIFEHSLTEIEELENEITSNQTTLQTDKGNSKRKKDGVFYTPKYITKYIVENTVGTLCKNKKAELKIEEADYHPLQKKKALKILLDNLHVYRDWLLKITIIDPACGSGAFLNQALEFLIAEHKFISELEANITGSSIVFDVENSILENNLFGVDINEESVEIAKLSLWLRTARKGRKLNSLNNNIKCGNSLIDDEAVAGEKAFVWEKEFPQFFKNKRQVFLTIVNVFKDRVEIDDRLKEYNKNVRVAIETILSKAVSKNISFEDALALATEDEAFNEQLIAEIKQHYERYKNPLAQIPKDKLALIKQYDPNENIKNFYDYVKWILDFSDETIKHDGFYWLNLLLNFDGEYVQKIAKENNISVQLMLTEIARRFLKDLESDFDKYEKYYLSQQPADGSGFDVVIGNPPYGAKLKDTDITFFRNSYKTVIGHSEAYYLFIERGLNKLLKYNSYLGYIIPNSWLSNKYATKIRELLIDETQISKLINFNRKIIFEDANVETSIIITKNSRAENNQASMVGQDLELLYPYDQGEWKANQNYLMSFAPNNDIDKIVKKMNSSKFKLKDKLDISNGFKPYQVGYGTNLNGEPLNSQDVENRIYHSSKSQSQFHKKEIKGKGVNRFSIKWEESYINWGKWLMSPKSDHYFEQPKILIRQVISDYFFAFLDTEKYFADQSLYVCTNYQDQNEKLEFYLCLINSRLYGFYFRKFYSEEDDLFPKIKVNELKNLPVPNVSTENQQPFIETAKRMLSKNKELQEATKQFVNLLQAKFETININTKLEKWYNLSFTDFSKELSKQKIKLTLAQESEWLSFFEQEKQKALVIKNEIDATDAAIDKMVYALYGLSEEEVRIVEGN